MKIYTQTERFILREILPADEGGFFELDSNPNVHTYLGNKPVTSIEQCREVIKQVRQQYLDYGIGRWSIIDKETNDFVGWTGLKLIKEEINYHIDFYDLGYRLIEKYWGQGIATETSIACLKYAFEKLNLPEVYGICYAENIASGKVLTKAGLKFIETFDRDGVKHHWYKITKEEWVNLAEEC